MKQPPAEVLSLMKVAAEKRAFGIGWSFIAAEVKRDERSCRRWTEVYPEVWGNLFREAEEKRHAEIASEALQVLYRVMRTSHDERLVQNTAKFLYSTRRSTVVRLPVVAPDSNPFPTLDPMLDDFADDQLRELLEEYLTLRRTQRGEPAPTRDPDPPSAQAPPVEQAPRAEQPQGVEQTPGRDQAARGEQPPRVDRDQYGGRQTQARDQPHAAAARPSEAPTPEFGPSGSPTPRAEPDPIPRPPGGAEGSDLSGRNQKGRFL